jgi:hypothetical protein
MASTLFFFIILFTRVPMTQVRKYTLLDFLIRFLIIERRLTMHKFNQEQQFNV